MSTFTVPTATDEAANRQRDSVLDELRRFEEAIVVTIATACRASYPTSAALVYGAGWGEHEHEMWPIALVDPYGVLLAEAGGPEDDAMWERVGEVLGDLFFSNRSKYEHGGTLEFPAQGLPRP